MILAGWAIALLLQGTPALPPPTPRPPLNVILISLDTLAPGHLSLYGYRRPTSPRLDAWARQGGVIFTHAISHAPWTLPSHAALFTSRHPHQLLVQSPRDRLHDRDITLAETLQWKGYTTAAFAAQWFFKVGWGLHQGFQHLHLYDGRQALDRPFETASTWLRQHHRERFFLFLHTPELHAPYLTTRSRKSEFDPHYRGTVAQASIGAIARHNLGLFLLSPEDLRHLEARYDSGIADLDRKLEDFFQLLHTLKLDRNTIVVVLSDHGEEFGEHGTWAMHGYSVYDEMIRVPLIIKSPSDGIRKSSSVTLSEPVALIDVAPTLMDLLGFAKHIPRQFEGQSQLPLITTGRPGPSRLIFSETALDRRVIFEQIERVYKEGIREGRERHTPLPERWLVSARSATWKLIRRPDGARELYHLLLDPKETHNLAGTSRPEETELQRALEDFLSK